MEYRELSRPGFLLVILTLSITFAISLSPLPGKIVTSTAAGLVVFGLGRALIKGFGLDIYREKAVARKKCETSRLLEGTTTPERPDVLPVVPTKASGACTASQEGLNQLPASAEESSQLQSEPVGREKAPVGMEAFVGVYKALIKRESVWGFQMIEVDERDFVLEIGGGPNGGLHATFSQSNGQYSYEGCERSHDEAWRQGIQHDRPCELVIECHAGGLRLSAPDLTIRVVSPGTAELQFHHDDLTVVLQRSTSAWRTI